MLFMPKMVIKRALFQFIFLLSFSAVMFVFLNNILLRDTRVFSEINRRDNLTFKRAVQERFLKIPNSQIQDTLCNMSSHGLLGKMDVDEGLKNWSAIEDLNPVCFEKYYVNRVSSCINRDRLIYITIIFLFQEVLFGGSYIPTTCPQEENMAILIPYRHRENHLKILLNHLHPMLRRQHIYYRIFVIEQVLMPF